MMFIQIATKDSAAPVIVNTDHIVSIHEKQFGNSTWFEIALMADVRHRVDTPEYLRIKGLLIGKPVPVQVPASMCIEVYENLVTEIGVAYQSMIHAESEGESRQAAQDIDDTRAALKAFLGCNGDAS